MTRIPPTPPSSHAAAGWPGRNNRAGKGNAYSDAQAPQSKPVAQTSRLVALNAPSVALGFGVKSGPRGQLTTYGTRVRSLYERESQMTPDSGAPTVGGERALRASGRAVGAQVAANLSRADRVLPR